MDEFYLIDLYRKMNSLCPYTMYTMEQVTRMYESMPDQRVGMLYDLVRAVKADEHLKKELERLSKILFPSVVS